MLSKRTSVERKSSEATQVEIGGFCSECVRSPLIVRLLERTRFNSNWRALAHTHSSGDRIQYNRANDRFNVSDESHFYTEYHGLVYYVLVSINIVELSNMLIGRRAVNVIWMCAIFMSWWIIIMLTGLPVELDGKEGAWTQSEVWTSSITDAK